jgi:hypothetical protein
METKTNIDRFAEKLVSGKFGEFFIYPMHDQTIDKIWSDPRNHQLLEKILDDPDISDLAKFLACEVLFKKDILFMQRHSPEKVAEVYAKALGSDFTGMANSWGLLYEGQDDGTVGTRFLLLGRTAIPALAKLLHDERTNLHYQGSAEATLGNKYGYRIKDFAAYYIGRITGNPIKYYPDPADRDEQIDRMRERLKRGD